MSDTPTEKAVRVLELQMRISEQLEDMAFAYQMDSMHLAELVAQWQEAVDDYLDKSPHTIKLVVNRGKNHGSSA